MTMPDESGHYWGEVSEHAIIFNEYGEILLLQHNGGGQGAQRPNSQSPMYGKWHFPGGRMEESDTPGDSLRREIEEETGLKNIDLILPCHVSRWGFKTPVKYSVAYLAQTKGRPEVTLPDHEDAMAWRWVPLAETKTLEMLTPTHHDVIAGVAHWARKLGVLKDGL